MTITKLTSARASSLGCRRERAAQRAAEIAPASKALHAAGATTLKAIADAPSAQRTYIQRQGALDPEAGRAHSKTALIEER